MAKCSEGKRFNKQPKSQKERRGEKLLQGCISLNSHKLRILETLKINNSHQSYTNSNSNTAKFSLLAMTPTTPQRPKCHINKHPAFPFFPTLQHRKSTDWGKQWAQNMSKPRRFRGTVLTLLKRLAWNKCPFTRYSFLHLRAPRR